MYKVQTVYKMQNNNTMVFQLSIAELEAIIRNVLSVELQKQNSSTEAETETESDELLTRDAVSKMLKVSFPTLWSWNKRGVLVAQKIGNKVLYEKAHVMAQLRNN
jgi:hypothetical protein